MTTDKMTVRQNYQLIKRLKIILKIRLLREKNIVLMFKLFTWSMVNDLLKPMLFTRIVMSSISVSSREASIFDNSIKASFVSSFLSKPTVSSKMKKKLTKSFIPVHFILNIFLIGPPTNFHSSSDIFSLAVKNVYKLSSSFVSRPVESKSHISKIAVKASLQN